MFLSLWLKLDLVCSWYTMNKNGNILLSLNNLHINHCAILISVCEFLLPSVPNEPSTHPSIFTLLPRLTAGLLVLGRVVQGLRAEGEREVRRCPDGLRRLSAMEVSRGGGAGSLCRRSSTPSSGGAGGGPAGEIMVFISLDEIWLLFVIFTPQNI